MKKIINVLVKHKANPYFKSLVENDEEECLIETAARWNHPKIVKLLLEIANWDLDTLEKCKKLSKNNAEINCYLDAKISSLLSEYSCVCCCLHVCKKSPRIQPNVNSNNKDK